MKRILVPCDFSETAQEAYQFALALALANKGEVFVLKAYDFQFTYESAFGVQPYVFDPMVIQEVEEGAKNSFNKMKDQFSATIPVQFEVVYGPVVSAVRQSIQNKQIDLVVMGTNGASGFKEFFIGSNTEKVVRTSPVPVFAIRKSPGIASIKNIVFPTTLALDQTGFMVKLKELQEFFKATLHVLLVNTPTDFKRDREIKPLLEEYARHYSLNRFTLNMRNDAFEMDGIIGFAHEIHADMIAMATHGRRGLVHWLSGSIAEDVVNHVDCPIWTYSLKHHN